MQRAKSEKILLREVIFQGKQKHVIGIKTDILINDFRDMSPVTSTTPTEQPPKCQLLRIEGCRVVEGNDNNKIRNTSYCWR